jgi:hypothetical protein
MRWGGDRKNQSAHQVTFRAVSFEQDLTNQGCRQMNKREYSSGRIVKQALQEKLI